MNVAINSNKKSKMAAIILTFLMFFGIAFGSGEVAHADTGDMGDMDFKFDGNGKMTVSGGGMSSSTKSGTAWSNFIKKYRNFIIGISGIGAVAMVMFFIFNLLKLGATSGNSSARSQALAGLAWSGVAAAGLGSVSVIVGFFYSALK